MAAVTTAAIGVAGMGLSAIQSFSGAKQKRDAAKALENLPVPELKNPYENLQVSTMGADLRQQEQQRLEGSQIEALQGAGVRGLVGGLGRVEAGSQAVSAQSAADLDAQRKAIDQAIAGDETAIRTMEEQRRRENVAALSSQFSAGQQQQWQGLQGAFQSAAAGASGYARIKGAQPVDTNTKIPATASTAITPSSIPQNYYGIGQFVPNQSVNQGSVPNLRQSIFNQQFGGNSPTR